MTQRLSVVYQQPVNRDIPSVTLGGSIRAALFACAFFAPARAVEQKNQLTEIRKRSGRQTWPEIALRLHL